MKNMKNKQGGFTLLELLVVVGIMAIIGGALISSFGGQETKAARGVATQAIAGVESAIRTHAVVEGELPSGLEALACVPFILNNAYDAAAYGALTVVPTVLGTGDSAAEDSAYVYGGESNLASVGGGMGLKVANKFTLTAIAADGVTALTEAGIQTVRYGIAAACDNDPASTQTVAIGTVSGEIGGGTLVALDIPGQAFEDPRPDGLTAWKNRGLGFSAPLAATMPLMVWKAGTDGYNNKKLGAAEFDQLIGLGVGASSDLVGNANSPFAKAPFYGQVGKDKYSHYIALINIGPVGFEFDVAFVQAVVDARGDFLDEEIAEFQGQKL
jgi:prepilin-type N-terminal cleavage/methylation domain-containing protein